MAEWKEYKLGEIAEFRTGKLNSNAAVDNGKYPFFTCAPETYYINNYAFDQKAILLAGNNAEGNFNIKYYEGRFNAYQRTYIINPISYDVDIHFLFYALQLCLNQFKTLSQGTSTKFLTAKILNAFSIQVPSLSIQKRIVDIIKSLDDKIELNRKINANLEAQAQALFKSWFVDFEPFKDQPFVESELGMIPEGWRIVSLDDMTSKFGTGLNPRKNFKLGEGNNYYVTIKNMGNNRVYLDDKCDKINDEAIEKINKRSKLQAGDLLFSGIGTIGRVALITETPQNWNTSESVFNMHPSEGISSEFLYLLLLSDEFQNYVKINAQGGVQQGIRMASLKQYQMALPNDRALRAFDNIATPIVSLIKENDKEIDRLASLRDALLPRLMSGELKVGEVEK